MEKKAKREITWKESVELEKAMEYLDDIIGQLRMGKFVIEKDGESLTFEPEGRVDLEVEVKVKEGKEKLEIELSCSSEKDSGEEEGEEVEEPAALEPEDESRTGLAAKMLPIAGLAAAGGAVFEIARRRRKSRIQRTAEKARKEGERILEEGQRLMEEGERALEKGGKKASNLLRRVRKPDKETVSG